MTGAVGRSRTTKQLSVLVTAASSARRALLAGNVTKALNTTIATARTFR